MNKEEFLSALLDSCNFPFVFVDTDHIIRYVNKPAIKNYAKWGDIMGKSIFHCHNEKSNQVIKECFEKLKNGTEEIMITDNAKHRVYMRRVIDKNDNFIGYYERYEPPKS